MADRVNLGLIPSSESSWLTACAALKSHSGGVLHVHATVTTSRSKSAHDSVECKQTVHSISDTTDKHILDLAVSSTATNAGMSSSGAKVDNAADANACKHSSAGSCDVDSVATAAAKVRMAKYAKTCVTKQAWLDWADTVCETLRCHLSSLQLCDWLVCLMHIEHVKSYAPHIDHVVADIECRPPS